jgi:hypothetical protein
MFDNIKPPCEAFAALGQQGHPGVTAFLASKLMVVSERPSMVGYRRRPKDESRAPSSPAREINQPSADGPTKAATIFANGKSAPAPSPSPT